MGNAFGEPLYCEVVIDDGRLREHEWDIHRSDGVVVCRVDDFDDREPIWNDEFAARIVAAVNLCAGHEDLGECVVVPRGLLAEAIEEIKTEIKRRYMPHNEAHPALRSRLKRDMVLVDALREALKGASDGA